MSTLLLREIRRQHHEEHAELDALMARLLSVARGRDGKQLQAAWGALERRLTSHLALEEQSLFPLIEARHEKEVRALRDEHAELRALVREIGLATHLNVIRKEALERLAALLAERGARADTNLARWLNETPQLDDRRQLGLFVEMMRAELRAG